MPLWCIHRSRRDVPFTRRYDLKNLSGAAVWTNCCHGDAHAHNRGAGSVAAAGADMQAVKNPAVLLELLMEIHNKGTKPIPVWFGSYRKGKLEFYSLLRRKRGKI